MKTGRRYRLYGLLLGVLVVAGAIWSSAYVLAQEAPPAWLVYSSDSLLKMVSLESGEIVDLTPEEDWLFAFEPAVHEGKIAFAGATRRNMQGVDVWVTNQEGSWFFNPVAGKKLLGDKFSSRNPTWSPDGDRIFFLCKPESWFNIYPGPNMICSVSGSGIGGVEVEVKKNSAHHSSLSVGPEGLTAEILPQIVVIWREGYWQPLFAGRYPRWTSDRLTYTPVTSEGLNEEICVAAGMATACYPKPKGVSAVIQPVLSANGRWIAFAGGPDYDIWVLNTATGQSWPVVATNEDEVDPVWFE